MYTALLSGGLDFAERDDVLYSTGLTNGQITLRGPLPKIVGIDRSQVRPRGYLWLFENFPLNRISGSMNAVPVNHGGP